MILLPREAGAGAFDGGANGGLLAVEIVADRQRFQVRKLGLGFLCQLLLALDLVALESKLMKLVTAPRDGRHVLDALSGERGGMPVAAFGERSQLDHVNAVDGAGWDTQIAAGAEPGQHGVHLLGAADDCVHRTGMDAKHAADATRFVNQRRGTWFLDAIGGIERLLAAHEQLRELADAVRSARGALVDVGFASRDCLGVRPASLIAALGALGLRQQRVYRVSQSGHR